MTLAKILRLQFHPLEQVRKIALFVLVSEIDASKIPSTIHELNFVVKLSIVLTPDHLSSHQGDPYTIYEKVNNYRHSSTFLGFQGS